MPQEMGVCANLLNADRQAFIKATLTKRGKFCSTITVICGRANLFCFAFFQLGRCPMTEADLAAIIVTVGIGTVLSNLILFGLMVKLYTEFAKQRMQEARKP